MENEKKEAVKRPRKTAKDRINEVVEDVTSILKLAKNEAVENENFEMAKQIVELQKAWQSGSISEFHPIYHLINGNPENGGNE